MRDSGRSEGHSGSGALSVMGCRFAIAEAMPAARRNNRSFIAGFRSRAPVCASDRTITFRTSVAEKLPHFANFRDHVEIKIGDYDFIFIPAGLRDNLSPRIAEITLAVKLANAPWLLYADAIDGADEISVGDGVRGLFELPQDIPRVRRQWRKD